MPCSGEKCGGHRGRRAGIDPRFSRKRRVGATAKARAEQVAPSPRYLSRWLNDRLGLFWRPVSLRAADSPPRRHATSRLHADTVPSSVLPAFALRAARARRAWARAALVEERVWERREEFLMLNPAGTTPVLVEEGHPPVPGAAIIAEYLDETRGAELARAPAAAAPRPAARVEVRRLPPGSTTSSSPRSAGPLVTERIYKRYMRIEQGGGPPDTEAIRAARDQHPLSSRLYRLAGAHARLAGRRPADLCRSGGGRASVGGRLSGRCAVERRRGREDLVRAGEVAPVVPSAAGRDAGRACRRRRATPTSTSERSCRDQGGPDRAGARARLRRRRRGAARRHRRGEAASRDLPRRRRAWRHGHGSRRTPSGAAIRARCGREVRSVIMLGLNYGPDDDDPLAILEQRDRGAISVYARRATTITRSSSRG